MLVAGGATEVIARTTPSLDAPCRLRRRRRLGTPRACRRGGRAGRGGVGWGMGGSATFAPPHCLLGGPYGLAYSPVVPWGSWIIPSIWTRAGRVGHRPSPTAQRHRRGAGLAIPSHAGSCGQRTASLHTIHVRVRDATLGAMRPLRGTPFCPQPDPSHDGSCGPGSASLSHCPRADDSGAHRSSCCPRG